MSTVLGVAGGSSPSGCCALILRRGVDWFTDIAQLKAPDAESTSAVQPTRPSLLAIWILPDAGSAVPLTVIVDSRKGRSPNPAVKENRSGSEVARAGVAMVGASAKPSTRAMAKAVVVATIRLEIVSPQTDTTGQRDKKLTLTPGAEPGFVLSASRLL